MSAKHLMVLALVAYVALQANSLPNGVKGGQSYSEPLKGSSSYVASQQFAEPVVSKPAPVVASAPVQASYQQYESAPFKGHYQSTERYEVPRAQQVHYESAPVQMSYAQAEPLKSQYVPLQRQPTYRPVQEVAPVQTPYVAPTYQVVSTPVPAKGGEYYQQSFERAPLAQAQYESAPVKGSYTQSFSEPLKSTSYVAPQPAMTVQQPLVSAPAQVQAPTVQAETVAAPVKGQSFYQPEQRFESAPLRQQVYPFKA